MVLTDGVRILDFGRTGYRDYTDAEREVLRAALGKASGSEVAAAASEAGSGLVAAASPASGEGSVAQLVMWLFSKNGVRWVASGEGVPRTTCVQTITVENNVMLPESAISRSSAQVHTAMPLQRLATRPVGTKRWAFTP